MTEQQLQWKRWGQYYGFPDCCIQFFLKNAHEYYWFRKVYPEGTKADGTGYIPCPECSKLPMKEMVDKINKERKSLTPFPQEGTFTQEQEHLNQLIKSGEIK